MTYPVNLVDIVCIAIAVACVRTVIPEAKGEIQKMWRLAVPPLLAITTALIVLAGAVETFEHDAAWVATGLLGSVAGLFRGRAIKVTTDQYWGLVQLPPAVEGVIVAFGVLICATVDGLSGLFPPGMMPKHATVAAVAALFAGYLGVRAWRVATRAMQAQHADLQARWRPEA